MYQASFKFRRFTSVLERSHFAPLGKILFNETCIRCKWLFKGWKITILFHKNIMINRTNRILTVLVFSLVLISAQTLPDLNITSVVGSISSIVDECLQIRSFCRKVCSPNKAAECTCTLHPFEVWVKCNTTSSETFKSGASSTFGARYDKFQILLNMALFGITMAVMLNHIDML
jgi:hypothetical protein